MLDILQIQTLFCLCQNVNIVFKVMKHCVSKTNIMGTFQTTGRSTNRSSAYLPSFSYVKLMKSHFPNVYPASPGKVSMTFSTTSQPQIEKILTNPGRPSRGGTSSPPHPHIRMSALPGEIDIFTVVSTYAKRSVVYLPFPFQFWGDKPPLGEKVP